jgi:hypothetical protein
MRCVLVVLVPSAPHNPTSSIKPMTQPEISEGLSPHHYQIIKDYLTRATQQRDESAPWLWMQLLACCHAGAQHQPGMIEYIAETYNADGATGRALEAGLVLINPQTEEDWDRLLEEKNPWRAFRTLGIEVEEPGPSGPTALAREVIRAAYEEAIDDIVATRNAPHLKNGFYKQVADVVFNTCYEALEHYTVWNNERGPAERASFDELRQIQNCSNNTVAPRLHVISAPMGAGKTTFTTAFIMAMVRLSNAHPSMPYGAAFLVDQIVKADGLWRELNKHLPGRVAIWTSDHDADCTEPKQVSEPAARFRKDDLRDYPVAIVTHALFQGATSDKARVVLHQGREVYRALTLADEQMQDVTTYSVQASVAEDLREKMQEAGHDTARIDALVKFMMRKAFGTGSLEKPADEPNDWKIAHDLALAWFTTDDARRYAVENRERWPAIGQVFGFARCMVADYAFIARDNRGHAGTHFLGYEPKHAIVPGMVLIDATADIDGVSQLCPWREHAEVPHGRYDNLSIVHVENCAEEGNLKKYLSTKRNRVTYVDWVKQVVLEHMEPDQRALVVCKKALLDHKSIPGPFPKNPAAARSADDPPYEWNVNGRKVGVTYWGGPGLGSNAWQDADVVFLFEDYFLPLRAAIASTQGHLMAPTTEGVIATMDALHSASTEVDWIGQGHILRWVRQMALRGRGRAFDEHGVCGEQRVVISGGRGSLERLVLHMNQLFPGAKLTISRNRDLSRYGHRERLLIALSDPMLPHELPAGRVGELMDVDWRDIAGHIMKRDTKRMLEAIGWTYVPVKGRGGSLFRRGATNRG